MYTTRRNGCDLEDARLHYEQLQKGKHNTSEQNEAFRKAFDDTNARWKAAVEQDKKVRGWFMSHYQVQFRSSGIVAFSASERAICQHWMECNDYGPDMAYIDPATGDTIPNRWVKGQCLELFKLVRCKT